MEAESSKGIDVTVRLESGEILPLHFWRKACVGDLRVSLKDKVKQFQHVELADIVICINSTTELSGRDRLSMYQSRLLLPKVKRRDEGIWSSLLRDTCLAPLSSFFDATGSA